MSEIQPVAPEGIAVPEGKADNPTPSVIDVESVKAFLDTEEGKALIQPKLDSHTTKGLETFKAKTLPKLVEEEVAKRNPEETPEQKRIRELEEKLNAQEVNTFKAELKSKTVNELTSKGLPVELSAMLEFDSEETMRDSIKQFEDIFRSYVDKAVDGRLKESGKTPTGQQNNGIDPKVMTKEKLLKMSTKESTEFFNKHPDIFRKLMASK